jgi:NAD(P)H dehydrogenase (quinone)
MKVLIVYHSVYGHVLQLAKAVEEGVKSVPDVEVVFRRAPEFPHTEKELEAGDGHASKVWQAQKTTPACTLDDLREADGLLLGSPTRYGNMSAQMKGVY